MSNHVHVLTNAAQFFIVCVWPTIVPICFYLFRSAIHAFLFFCIFFHRTYTYNDRRYGHYQPNGYGYQYPGQKNANQYPQGVPLGDDKFKYDPVTIEFREK